MKLLIWSSLLCLACNNVCGMFFELPDNAAAAADANSEDDFIGNALTGINQYFSIQGPTTTPKLIDNKSAAAAATTTTSTGFLSEMETSLEHATDTLDDIWQQIRKGVLRLVGGDNDDSKETDRRKVALTSSLQQLQTTTSLFVGRVTSTIHMPTTTKTIATTTTLPSAATTTEQPPLL